MDRALIEVYLRTIKMIFRVTIHAKNFNAIWRIADGEKKEILDALVKYLDSIGECTGYEQIGKVKGVGNMNKAELKEWLKNKEYLR